MNRESWRKGHTKNRRVAFKARRSWRDNPAIAKLIRFSVCSGGML
jgi:hypothetical protein